MVEEQTETKKIALIMSRKRFIMVARTKADVDKEIRSAGEARIDFDGLTAVNGNTWIGEIEVEGKQRFFEIKVVAKAEKFTADELQGLLDERAEVEARKAEKKVAAVKKAEKDAKRRADAKAKAEKTE